MIEITWLVIALIGLGITLDNLWGARNARRRAEDDDEQVDSDEPAAVVKARVLVAHANVRREAVRVVMCAALAIVTIPALQRPGDVTLTVYIAILMLVPVGMALNSYLDRKERRDIERLAAENGH